MSRMAHISRTSPWAFKPTSPVLLGSCLVLLLIFFAVTLQPTLTSNILRRAGEFYLGKFPHWIIWSVGFFMAFAAILTLVPSIGRRTLGSEGGAEKFSFFTWFSMIFGAGMAIGLLTWGIAEPIAGIKNNPDVIRNMSSADSTNNVSSALKWSYAHWGFAGWASYALVGLAIAYTGYRQNLPLTMRTALIPLFGQTMKGVFGHMVDVLTVVVTLFGIFQVLGYALDESIYALAITTDALWLLDEQGNATVLGKILTSVFVMLLATVSAISGVKRGVKWFSNANMLLSLVFLALILFATSIGDALTILISSSYDYIVNLPSMLFVVWAKDGTDMGDNLQSWQGTWTMYHWAGWWLSFAPFIGIFLAKISKGRSIRQYLFATVVLPAFLTMVWMSWVGGSAIAMELDGLANGELIDATVGLKIFALMQLMFDSWSVWFVSIILLILLVSFLVTSIDSALIVSISVLSIESRASGYKRSLLVWSIVVTVGMTALILTDGFSSIRSAMVVASAPISFLIVLLCVSLGLALVRDKSTDPESTNQ